MMYAEVYPSAAVQRAQTATSLCRPSAEDACETRLKGVQLVRESVHKAGAVAPTRRPILWALSLIGLCCAALLLSVVPARALGPNALMYPTGWNTNAVTRGDDTSNLVVNIPFTMNWLGTNYTQLYLNMNGNVTFTSGFTSYQPGVLTGVGQGIMAPFWADVDTRYVGSPNLLYYSNITSGSVTTVNGRKAMLVTWAAVQYYNNGNTTSQTATDTFQLVIVDRSDTGAGNFDFIYNYDQMLWDKGTAGATFARAGWAANATTGFELPGSGTSGALLDGAATSTALVKKSLDSGGQLGRYVWQVRGGTAPNVLPSVSVTDRTLEGNAPNSYSNYTGTGDATASDADGSIASFTSNPSLPATLPLGTTNITWTATDNRSAVTTDLQTVVVTDTTSPSAPALSSPTHATGVWTNIPTVTVNSVNSTDVCSGMRGNSYSWSLNSPSAPDATLDPSTITTVTVVDTTTVESQAFAGATFPADWNPSDATYARVSATRFHLAANGGEIWANNNTRRTVNFSKTFDLDSFQSATLTFWDYRTAFSSAADYELVRYSTNGGTTWTNLQQTTGASALQGWTQHTYSLPPSSTVLLQFSASVNAATEYVNFDEISVIGYPAPRTFTSLASVATTSLADGTWYFNTRTVDNAGNWTGTSSFGPVLIDRYAPTTTDNAPSGWSTAPVTVSLTATDAGSGVAYTRYRVNAGAVATYTAPFTVSAEQTNTVQYWSVDNRGNVETTKSATVRIDSGPPTVPGSFSASAVTTTSVEMAWTASTDATSGLSHYRVYRDGSFVATSATTTYVLSGLNAGQTYAFNVAAVDVAGNVSSRSTTDTELMPVSQIWLTIDPTAVSIGSLDPGVTSTLTSATAITVGGVGIFNYDLSCSCENFSNVATASITPTMPASLMSYRTFGSATLPLTPFSTTAQMIDTAAGVKFVWNRPYYFDYVINVPWAFSPGTYTTKVTYTAVAR